MGQQEIRRLQEALADATGMDGVSLDEELHDDFKQLIKEHSKMHNLLMRRELSRDYFWAQQQIASSLKNSKLICWHLLIIK